MKIYNKTKSIIVLGVSGCGKSTIGKMLARKLNYRFFDGDDYHSQNNVNKMESGVPLTDADRYNWLKNLNQLLSVNPYSVLACSALKPSYRNLLKEGNHSLQFVYLQGSFEEIWARHQQRNGHYFNGKQMLESQFKTLIEPGKDEAIVVNINQSPENIVNVIAKNLTISQVSD